MANWEEILKKPLVSIPKQMVRIKKPKKIEQEDDCRGKLLEIALKMPKVPLFALDMNFNDNNWTVDPARSLREGGHGGIMKHAVWIPSEYYIKNTKRIHGALGTLRGVSVSVDIDKLPEEVCCEALKFLNAAADGNRLPDKTLLGWTIGSTVKLTTRNANNTDSNDTHHWLKNVYIKNAQLPEDVVNIGLAMKIYVNPDENMQEVTRVFKECIRMFREAVA